MTANLAGTMATRQVYVEYVRDLPKYETEKPFNLSFSTYHDGFTTNVEKEETAITVRDVRGQEDQFSLGEHSFRFLKLPTDYPIDGSEETTFRYLDETRKFLLRELDAEQVICYDIRVGLPFSPFQP